MITLPVREWKYGDELSHVKLRDDITDFVLNPSSIHGPLIHARRANRHIVFMHDCIRVTRAEVEQMWANELVLRPRGLTIVGFCASGMCVCRPVQVAA